MHNLLHLTVRIQRVSVYITLTGQSGQRPVPFLEAVCDRGDQTSMPRGGSYQEQQNCTTTIARTLYTHNIICFLLFYIIIPASMSVQIMATYS